MSSHEDEDESQDMINNNDGSMLNLNHTEAAWKDSKDSADLPSQQQSGYMAQESCSDLPVPDLYNKILAKIRLNERNSEWRNIHNPSFFKIKTDVIEEEETNNRLKEEESPVTGQELNTYLASMFYMVDTSRTGLVSARSLLEYLGTLVDLPRLDEWKLEELSRMLDPHKDDREVDMELWSEVGQSLVEMILNPENHSESSSDKKGDILRESEEQDLVNVANTSCGSIEGVGGVPGCEGREVELENKVSQLSFQLGRLAEDKKELERNLAASEDFGVSLTSFTTELEGSHRRLSLSLSTSINKGEILYEEVKQVREVEERSLIQKIQKIQKIEILSKELNIKDDEMNELALLTNTLGEELDKSKERENVISKQYEEEKMKCNQLKYEIEQKNVEVEREIDAREKVEEKLESKQLGLEKLELELLDKDEKIRNLTAGDGRNSSLGSSQTSSVSESMVHDVSVDDKVFEENLKSHRNPALVFTPGKLPLYSPIGALRRGPSASSTPNKGRLGSLADELQESDNSGFPSPVSAKKGNEGQKNMLKVVERLGESVRKIIIEKMVPGQSKNIMAILNKEVVAAKKVLESLVDELPSKEEMRILEENALFMQERLAEAEAEIAKLNSMKNEEIRPEIMDGEVDVLSKHVNEILSLLKSANNSALLAVTHDGSVTFPNLSLAAETDLSNWQLDLEGIQLTEYSAQLSKKLIQYTTIGKRNTITEISSSMKSPFPTELSRAPILSASLWQSVHFKLDELKKESEVSSYLLMMAEDSMKEMSMNMSTNCLQKDSRTCQTDPQPDSLTAESLTYQSVTANPWGQLVSFSAQQVRRAAEGIPIPGASLLWQSLYTNLEKPQMESSEGSNQSTRLLFPKTVSCQTESFNYQSESRQGIPTSNLVSQYSQTEECTTSQTASRVDSSFYSSIISRVNKYASESSFLSKIPVPVSAVKPTGRKKIIQEPFSVVGKKAENVSECRAGQLIEHDPDVFLDTSQVENIVSGLDNKLAFYESRIDSLEDQLKNAKASAAEKVGTHEELARQFIEIQSERDFLDARLKTLDADICTKKSKTSLLNEFDDNQIPELPKEEVEFNESDKPFEVEVEEEWLESIEEEFDGKIAGLENSFKRGTEIIDDKSSEIENESIQFMQFENRKPENLAVSVEESGEKDVKSGDLDTGTTEDMVIVVQRSSQQLSKNGGKTNELEQKIKAASGEVDPSCKKCVIFENKCESLQSQLDAVFKFNTELKCENDKFVNRNDHFSGEHKVKASEVLVMENKIATFEKDFLVIESILRATKERLDAEDNEEDFYN